MASFRQITRVPNTARELSPIQDEPSIVVSRIPTKLNVQTDFSHGSEEATGQIRQPRDVRGSRPSNTRTVVNPDDLANLADSKLINDDLTPIIASLKSNAKLNLPQGFGTIKSGGWNARKAILIGRILLLPEGREMLLEALKRRVPDIVPADRKLHNFYFKAGSPKTTEYAGNVAPSLKLWEDILSSYGDRSPNRNPKFTKEWFTNYFSVTNRNADQDFVEPDAPLESTMSNLMKAIQEEITVPGIISRHREQKVAKILELMAYVDDDSLDFAIETFEDEIRKADEKANEKVKETEDDYV